MFKKATILVACVGLYSLTAMAESPLTAAEVRKIVQEEFALREKQVKKREDEIRTREAKVSQKEQELLKHTSSSKADDTLTQSITNQLDKKVSAPGPFSIELKGYGDIQGHTYTYNEGEAVSEGSRGQSRTNLDTKRFVMELEAKHEPTDLEIEAEIEFEHGGTGSAKELEADEFGEYESEVEKGGEVIVEELYAKKEFGDGWSGQLGRFYTALGTLSYYYRPTDYLGVNRSEVEETMLPGQWDEIGLGIDKQFEFGSATLQLVNGLDSAGFSSDHWIAGGHQESFESIRAEDPAVVARLNVTSLYPGLTVGTAVYAGNTSGNRAKDDIDGSGTLVIGAANFRYWTRELRTQGAFYLGHLSDAAEISDVNSRLPNTLGASRSPVADEALGLWTEVGYNIAPFIGMREPHALTPFVRFEHFDTQFDTADSIVDNPKFERTLYSAGVAYDYDDFMTLKLDWTHRTFGGSGEDDQNIFGFGFGFVY